MFFRSLKKEKSSSGAGGYVVKAFFALSKQLWSLWLTLKRVIHQNPHLRHIHAPYG